MDPLLPHREPIVIDPALNVTVELDSSDERTIPRGPTILFPSEPTRFALIPLLVRGLTWLTGTIVIGALQLLEITNSCSVDGFLTLMRLLTRTKNYDVTTLFKSETAEGVQLENVLRHLVRLDGPNMMRPSPTGIVSVDKKKQDTYIKRIWCDYLQLPVTVQTNGKSLVDILGLVSSRVETILNPVRYFIRSYSCNCPHRNIQRKMGGFRITTQNERFNFENNAWEKLPDYAPSCTCQKCKAVFVPTDIIEVPPSTWVLWVNIEEKGQPLEPSLNPHEFANTMTINGDQFVKVMGVYKIESLEAGGIGHATYTFYSQGNTYYYDSMLSGGNILPQDAPKKATPESVVYIRVPEPLATPKPTRGDEFHLGP